MTEISLQTNIDAIARDLPRFYRRQIPFAASQALNDTARLAATVDVRKALETDLDQVKGWTKTGVQYRRSTKSNLTAAVFIRPDRWEYLRYQVQGGTRRPRGKLIVIPTPENRTGQGRIKRGWIQRMVARPDTFWITRTDGSVGLYQRKGRRGKTTLLAHTTPSAEYRPRFDYAQAVDNSVERRFNRAFSERLQHAIKTARI